MRSIKEIATLGFLVVAIAYPIALAMRAFEIEPKNLYEPNLGTLAWPLLIFSQAVWFVKLNASRKLFRSTLNLLGTMTLVSVFLIFPAAVLILLGLGAALDLGVEPTERLGVSEAWCVLQSLGGIASVIVALT